MPRLLANTYTAFEESVEFSDRCNKKYYSYVFVASVSTGKKNKEELKQYYLKLVYANSKPGVETLTAQAVVTLKC